MAGGRLSRAGLGTKAEALLKRLARLYPSRLYVELQRHPTEAGALPEAEREDSIAEYEDEPSRLSWKRRRKSEERIERTLNRQR